MPPAKVSFDDEGRRGGTAVDGLVAGGCVLSGGTVRGTPVFTGVRVNACGEPREAVVPPYADDIGRHARPTKVAVDPRRAHPAGAGRRRGPGGGRPAFPPHR